MNDDKTRSAELQALSAVHEEVLKLLAQPLPLGIEQRIALIESICRHGHDIRTEEERKA